MARRKAKAGSVKKRGRTAPKKKKKAVAKRKTGTKAAAAATRTLRALSRSLRPRAVALESAGSVVGDGSLQVIMAIASVTTLVTVDATTRPPTVSPPNLGGLTFNDRRVGLSNTQMALFKASLTELLQEIAAQIAKIPENAGLKIAEVANFVRLALLAG
jgi:hypothetical protein